MINLPSPRAQTFLLLAESLVYYLSSEWEGCSRTFVPLASGGFVPRCKSQNTKHSEVRFYALLGGGVREVRLEWGDGRRLVGDVFS
jgi:hypothetical protein